MGTRLLTCRNKILYEVRNSFTSGFLLATSESWIKFHKNEHLYEYILLDLWSLNVVVSVRQLVPFHAAGGAAWYCPVECAPGQAIREGKNAQQGKIAEKESLVFDPRNNRSECQGFGNANGREVISTLQRLNGYEMLVPKACWAR